jgi:bacillithiol biosynthesis deacetylase BshB1
VKILAVGPHPDDIEFGCAPILIQEVRNGNQVKIAVLSKGEAGSHGTPEERVEEATAAARVMGAEIGFLDQYLDHPLERGGDCHLSHSPENAFAIAAEIRRFQPRIVLAPHPDENQHPDHSAAARLVRDAARLARYRGLKDLQDLPPHAIGNLYFYSITQTSLSNPDIVIDVSSIESLWEAAIACHASQMKTKAYLNLVQTRARALGASIGVSSALGLWVNDPIRLGSLSDLTLSSRNF